MKKNLIDFLHVAFPFLLTIGLWRLSVPFWNPGGILAIIPIFFCSFVSPIKWFGIFSVLMCMCLDYNFETVCFWIAMYCLFYAINGFQSLVDISRLDKNGLGAFAIFFGLCVLIQVFTNLTWTSFSRGIFMFIFVSLMYMPITLIIQRMRHDR